MPGYWLVRSIDIVLAQWVLFFLLDHRANINSWASLIYSCLQDVDSTQYLAESLLLFKLPSSTYNHPLQSHINMANTRKPAANTPKQPSAGAQPKVTVATKENENIQPCLSTATRPALTLKSSWSSVRDSKMDIESAALIASSQG